MQRFTGAIFPRIQCSASYGKGLSPHCYWFSLACPIPSLSPINHMWDHLRRRVGRTMSLNELEARLQQIWNEMSQDIIQNLYTSMPDRIIWCIRSRGVQQEVTQSCGSPVVKVSDHGRHVMSSSPVPLKTSRVGERSTLNPSRAQTSSRW
ncbi:uncharacterized protein TNCV_134121 [Trichonephila clavipes]|nr:uncharacterized protein TNCV_134121 [Trichonephila clavipes]